MLICNLRLLMAQHQVDDISDVMRMSGTSRNSITKLYRGVDVEFTKIDTLIKICDAFDCKLSDLIEYTPDK